MKFLIRFKRSEIHFYLKKVEKENMFWPLLDSKIIPKLEYSEKIFSIRINIIFIT